MFWNLKGLDLCSQWGKRNTNTRGYTYHKRSWTSDDFSKSHHFPTGHRCSPFPETRLHVSILSWSTKWVFSDRGEKSYQAAMEICVSNSQDALENLTCLNQSSLTWKCPGALWSCGAKGVIEKHPCDSRLSQAVDKISHSHLHTQTSTFPSYGHSSPGAGQALLLLNHLPKYCNFQPSAWRWNEIHAIVTCHCMFFRELRWSLQLVNFHCFLLWNKTLRRGKKC